MIVSLHKGRGGQTIAYKTAGGAPPVNVMKTVALGLHLPTFKLGLCKELDLWFSYDLDCIVEL